jgi:hypothetical protein
MNKKDLIARLVKQNGIHPVAFGLALSDISEAVAMKRARSLGRRAGLLSQGIKLGLPLLALGSLAIVYCCAPATQAEDATFYAKHLVPALRGAYAWFILVVMFGLMLGGVKLAGDEWLANPDVRRFLEPVAGTPKELDVASLLENGGPAVTAWRDIAVQEHGQLYGFDVEVMRGLFQLFAAEQREAAKKSEQIAAAAVPVAPPAEIVA